MSAGTGLSPAAAWWEGHPDLLPPEPELEPLHQRDYLIRAYRRDESSVLIRGAVMDLRPGRSFAERITAAGGTDDGRPLPVHHMVVDLVVAYPALTITGVEVLFETHPQPGCPSIAPRYQDLVGLSIARGFTHEVRQRFGGPRGCTHTTALLQAMSPVAVQCVFAMRNAALGAPAAGATGGDDQPAGVSAFMKDTCHVWAEDGDLWQGVTMGRMPPVPLPAQRRLSEGGIDPALLDPRDPKAWGDG